MNEWMDKWMNVDGPLRESSGHSFSIIMPRWVLWWPKEALCFSNSNLQEESLGNPCGNADLNSAAQSRADTCFSDKPLGDTDASSSRVTLWVAKELDDLKQEQWQVHLFLKSSFLLSSLTFIFTKVLKRSNASRRGSHATWLNFLLFNHRPTSQTSVYIQNFVWCHFSFWIRSWPRSSTKHPVLHDFTFYKRWGEDVRMLRWTKFKTHQKMDSYPHVSEAIPSSSKPQWDQQHLLSPFMPVWLLFPSMCLCVCVCMSFLKTPSTSGCFQYSGYSELQILRTSTLTIKLLKYQTRPQCLRHNITWI